MAKTDFTLNASNGKPCASLIRCCKKCGSTDSVRYRVCVKCRQFSYERTPCEHEKPKFSSGKERKACYVCHPANRKLGRKPTKQNSMVCIICKNTGYGISGAKYCSPKCRNDAYNEKISNRALGRNRSERECRGCGVLFCGINNLSRPKFCHPACHQKQVGKRKAKDPLHQIKLRIKSLIHSSLRRRNIRKSNSTVEILGCTVQQFINHIEMQFLPGMTWERNGAVHIDHIVPLSTATTKEEVIALNHFTNLRPMWARDNLLKGANLNYLI